MGSCAIQDSIADNLCFGCGPGNPHGLQIKSQWDGDESVCTYQPQPHQAAGPAHIVNGGIIATLIDCHCVCTAIADAYRRVGRDIGTEPKLWYATGQLNVTYLRPTPIDRPVHLRTRITNTDEEKTVMECTMTSDGTPCATAEVIAVCVPKAWTEPQPATSKQLSV